jgi:hypothetical protein
MKVYTNIKTLKKAWGILKDLDLQNLLSGEKVKVDVGRVTDLLLEEGKINEFCQTVTKTEEDFEEKDLSEVCEVIASFFSNISASFQKLAERIKVNQVETKPGDRK